MNCEDVLRRLTEDEEKLSPMELEEMRLHFEACQSCRAEHDLLEASWEMLDAWDDVEPSSDFAAGVMARVRADEACAPVREALVASNGEVDADVRPHVERCSACASHARDMATTWQALGEWRDIEPSAEFTQVVLRKVEKSPRLVPNVPSEAVRPTVAPRRWILPRAARSLASLAAAVMMIVGVLFLMQPTPPQGPPVLDQYVKTFDGGRPRAVLDDLPVYVADNENLLDDLKEPPVNGKEDDAVIEEILGTKRHGEG